MDTLGWELRVVRALALGSASVGFAMAARRHFLDTRACTPEALHRGWEVLAASEYEGLEDSDASPPTSAGSDDGVARVAPPDSHALSVQPRTTLSNLQLWLNHAWNELAPVRARCEQILHMPGLEYRAWLGMGAVSLCIYYLAGAGQTLVQRAIVRQLGRYDAACEAVFRACLKLWWEARNSYAAFAAQRLGDWLPDYLRPYATLGVSLDQHLEEVVKAAESCHAQVTRDLLEDCFYTTPGVARNCDAFVNLVLNTTLGPVL
ncbi:uncharacterized protein MONBRDRAFT_11515 [Monosiga brevicollis MX1]|uniref:Uncharacterized protein n=1 Tax=Monosiga brevicollis TaxID=81824 RepID=A9V9D6_MONBE|nr:uncharacterized protein MONBRDRAFT_11515 [Monosiga brevicollis MX1]EDQ85911.1 predicted protein [Monosiga brevicollis MX1]|eukprot:XP_001749390.1 hypothetical protein [Monosiga brevicollis MX1]